MMYKTKEDKCLQVVDGLVNSRCPDQTAPLRPSSTLFPLAYLSKN